MSDPRDRPLDLVAEILQTPTAQREHRLGKLPRTTLVRLVSLLCLRLERNEDQVRPSGSGIGEEKL